MSEFLKFIKKPLLAASDFEVHEGVVAHENGHYFVQHVDDNRKFVFNNLRTLNPYRGLGSMSKTSIVLVEEFYDGHTPAPGPMLQGLLPIGRTFGWILTASNEVEYDNTFAKSQVGPILSVGALIRFVSPDVDRLIAHPETGHVACFCRPASHDMYITSFSIPDSFDGIALNVQRV